MSKPKCYCGQELRPDGTCAYRCPPEARPAHLRAQASKRLANSRRERLTGRGSFPSADEMRAVPAANEVERRIKGFYSRRGR
jgi:protocatechuate 3,4-dioxygenase beta subunit